MPSGKILFLRCVKYSRVLKWVTRTRSVEAALIAFAYGVWWTRKPKQAIRWAHNYRASVKTGKRGYIVRFYRRL